MNAVRTTFRPLLASLVLLLTMASGVSLPVVPTVLQSVSSTSSFIVQADSAKAAAAARYRGTADENWQHEGTGREIAGYRKEGGSSGYRGGIRRHGSDVDDER